MMEYMSMYAVINQPDLSSMAGRRPYSLSAGLYYLTAHSVTCVEELDLHVAKAAPG